MGTESLTALFRRAVDDHMGIFLKAAYGFTSDSADRDDLVQEILISVWQALPLYNGACQLSTFLYRVAHNRALTWQRTRTRYRRKLERLAEYPQLTIDTESNDVWERRLDWMYQAIRKLPPLDRTLIMLQLDRLSHREIGEITGLSESNVGVRLHRIRASLAIQTTDTQP